MKTRIADYYKRAAALQLVAQPDANALTRARRAYKRNLAEPGDSKGDGALLIGLAIAQADIGMGPGWIPETQRVGVEIAKLIETAV